MPFVKGQSGNPGGRCKTLLPDGRSVAELARQHTQEAIETLVAVMGNEDSSDAARVSAANAILDRGWGKPRQDIEHSGEIALLTKEQRDAAVAAAARADK